MGGTYLEPWWPGIGAASGKPSQSVLPFWVRGRDGCRDAKTKKGMDQARPAKGRMLPLTGA